MILIALGIVFAGLGALSLSKSDSDSDSSSASVSSVAPTANGATTGGAGNSSPVTSAASATADKSDPISVYNGGQIGGLAARVSTQLEEAGWNVATTANYPDSAVAANSVFYDEGAADQKAAALEIAEEIDATAKVKTAAITSLGDGVIVVVVTE